LFGMDLKSMILKIQGSETNFGINKYFFNKLNL